MAKIFIFVLAAIVAVSSADQRKVNLISSSQIVTKNGTVFHPAITTLTCSYEDKSLRHGQPTFEFFSMEGQPENNRSCNSVDCPPGLNFITPSVQNGGKLEIINAEFNTKSMRSSCFISPSGRNSEDDLSREINILVIDVDEVPEIVGNHLDASIGQDEDTALLRFECKVATLAPLTTYEWYLDNDLLPSSESKLELNVTRDDFGKKLECSVTKKDLEDNLIGDPISSEIELTFKIDPVLRTRSEGSKFELIAQSWPPFISIMVSANDDEEVIYYNLDATWETNDDKAARFLDDFRTKMPNLATTEFSMTFGCLNYSQVLVKLNTETSGINTTIYLPKMDSNENAANRMQSTDGAEQLGSIPVIPIAVGVICLVVIILLVVTWRYRKNVSEYFKCGVYNLEQDVEGSRGDQKEPMIGKDATGIDKSHTEDVEKN